MPRLVIEKRVSWLVDSSGLMRALFDARDNHALVAADFQKCAPWCSGSSTDVWSGDPSEGGAAQRGAVRLDDWEGRVGRLGDAPPPAGDKSTRKAKLRKTVSKGKRRYFELEGK